MEIETKKAWNLDTNQECEIELPANSIIRESLLEIDYPLGGLDREKIVAILTGRFSLTDEQKNAKNKAGQRVFNRYVGDVVSSLIKSGKLVEPKAWWVDINRDGENKEDIRRPEISIKENYQQIRTELAAELLRKIKDNTPAFFEKLVIDLLFKMGYGGSREDAQAVGRSGDGGIDGIIKADPLGLNVVYIQAKRWEGNVGAPPIRDFVGALDGEGVQDGIFITTSDFNPAAKEFAGRSSKRVILINGSQLARYMIDHNVGVSTVETYEIKRVDSDYFAENTE